MNLKVGTARLGIAELGLLLMIYTLHYLKDPKLWELIMVYSLLWAMRDLYHPP